MPPSALARTKCIPEKAANAVGALCRHTLARMRDIVKGIHLGFT